MPRTTNKTTRNAASSRDTRHENGLAPPGKRLPRQRSNGQLNGLPNGKLQSAVTPPALPSTGLNQGFKFPRSADSNITSTSISSAAATEGASTAAAAKDHAAALDALERERTSSDASLEDVGPCGEVVTDNGHEYGVSTPIMESAPPMAAAGKTSTTNAAGTMSTVSTILTYYPLRDAISILIILLSLPPALVLVIQTLFASLTFVPPTAGLSLSTLPNIKEMFNSPNFGYPAMATILLVDCLFALVWLPLWKPAQAIFLDLSQAVIAVSLSGAAASSGGPTYSIATCTFLVCIVHVLRYKAIHLTALDYLRSVLHKYSDLGIPFDASVSAQSFSSLPTLERGIFFSAFRTILGIHIVSQGVTTCIRRTLANAKAASEALKEAQSVPAITRTDTEATAGTEPPTRHSTGLTEASHLSQIATSSDGRPPGQPPAPRESKAREANSKKKRKQANQVRSQQPLWAAIASTKVTFVKEMEQRDAADDAREAAVMDNNTNNAFASTTLATTDRIWICEVRDTEVYFIVDLSQESLAEGADGKEEAMIATAGIDRTKPFFVRINGAAWSSARITPRGEGTANSFDGEIFGLAPISSYHCEIVSVVQRRVLCSASLITQPAPTAEQAAAVAPPPQHQALRPSSPITTLKQSIAAAEIKLNEARNRSRKSKKDQRAAHADIKKEINTLRSKLDSSIGIDDKQERRLQQISQHKNQAEEATRDLQAQIDRLGEIPADERAQSEAKRRTWQSAMDAVKSAHRELENSKAEQEREANALKADLSASESKKEKLVARITQRTQELEKLVSKQQAELDAKQARQNEKAQTSRGREHQRNELQKAIASMESEIQSLTLKAQDAYQQAAALSGWQAHHRASYPSYSSPPTPDGILPGTANGQVSPQANCMPPFSPHMPFQSPYSGSAQPVHGHPRGRSSSMLSQYSGFTDNADDYVVPDPRPQTQQAWLNTQHQVYTTAGAYEGRKPSDGEAAHGEGSSGSSSQSGGASGAASLMNGSANGSNSPRPEAKPFIPGSVGMAARASPGVIGPPNKRTTQTPPQSPSDRYAGLSATGDGNR